MLTTDGREPLFPDGLAEVPVDLFVDCLCSATGIAAAGSATRPLPVSALGGIAPEPVKLLVPDEEAATVASRPQARSKRLLREYEGQAWKLKTNWIKNWKKQHLLVDQNGLTYSKNPGRDQTVIALDRIETVALATQDDVSPKVRLKPESFVVRVQDGRTYVFSAEGSALTAAKWCKALVSHALVHATQNHMNLDRITQLVDLGADVNAALPDGQQYPPLALAVIGGQTDVAQFLLRRGADPSCLLRWSFVITERATTPVAVLQLLLDTKKDLNVVSDDAHGWTLLHYLARDGDFQSVRSLIARVDIPTINAVNTLGDNSLALALKQHGERPSEPVQKLCLALVKSTEVDRLDKWGNSLLHLAVRQGHEQLARRLVELGARVDLRDAAGNTPLHLAVRTGAFSLAIWIVERLSEETRTAVLDMQDHERGDTVLTMALKLGNEDLALFFLKNGADCSITPRLWDLTLNCARDIPLQIAIKMELVRLATAMIEGKETTADLCKLDSEGKPALVLVLERDLLPLALVMVQRASPGNAEFLDVATGTDEDTALLVALRKGLIVLASRMVDCGAGLHVRNRQGHSPLHECVDLISDSRPERKAVVLRLMRGLLAHGAGLDTRARTKSHQHTALHLAVLSKERDSAALFLQHDRTLANDLDKRGNSGLSLAILERDVSMVSLLISHGADVDVVNADSHSPLHLSVQVANKDMLSLLLQNGAYPAVWDASGRAPLHNAVTGNQHELVELFAELCRQPGHLDVRTEDGLTAIMLAVQGGCLESARSLLRHGVDLRAKVPRSRHTVFHIAGDLALGKRRPFWGSGVGELLLAAPHKGALWDRDDKLTTAKDAMDYLKHRFESPDEDQQSPSSASQGGDEPGSGGEPDSSASVVEPPSADSSASVVEAKSAVSEDSDLATTSNQIPPALPLPAPISTDDCGRESDARQNKRQGEAKVQQLRRAETAEPPQVGGDGSGTEESVPPSPATSGSDSPVSPLHHALQTLPIAARVEIRERLKLEGRKTADEWMATSAGKSLIHKKAVLLQNAKSGLRFDDALELAAADFLAMHMEQWMRRLIDE